MIARAPRDSGSEPIITLCQEILDQSSDNVITNYCKSLMATLTSENDIPKTMQSLAMARNHTPTVTSPDLKKKLEKLQRLINNKLTNLQLAVEGGKTFSAN